MRSARRRIVDALRRELMGPYEGPDERFSREYPTSRYIVGRLAPLNQEIPSEENDVLNAGELNENEGSEDEPLPLVLGFHPSSIGLSFLVESECASLDVIVTWGDYKREASASESEGHASDAGDVAGAGEGSEGGETGAGAPKGPGTHWQRYPRETRVSRVPIPAKGRFPRICLKQSEAPAGVVITGFEDGDIAIEGVAHQVDGLKAISLFLVNRREALELSNRSKDERWMLQARLEVLASNESPAFLARQRRAGLESDDRDAHSYELLYREVREFAAGHGVAADWEVSTDPARAVRLWTEHIPLQELPSLIAPTDIAGNAVLDMKRLAALASGNDAKDALSPLVDRYEDWIADRRGELTKEPFLSDRKLFDVADEHLRRCEISAKRMRSSLNLLASNPSVFEAFQFANRAMWDQRIHALWAQANRKRGQVDGQAADFDEEPNRTWRPFQMGFILQCLAGIADPEGDGADDRHTADLLWFPTGGGKTEAYLGLAAFTLGLRRLNSRGTTHGGAGVTVLMRYTLRLLTVQQFQRAAALIAACEVIRRSDPPKWGEEPFRIGLWVGNKTTPNAYSGRDSARDALDRLNQGQRPKAGSPVQLFSCPRCGETLADEKNGTPLNGAYRADDPTQRVITSCRNATCDLTERNSPGVGIPAVVVDDEVYRLCPSLLIATVDKFAQLAYNGRTQMIFGRRNRFSPTYGHLGEAHGDEVGGRRVKDAQPAEPLLPPELIIQDELHLISGPLGTLVGLYETAIDALCERQGAKGPFPAKIVASTATIRRASQQMSRLYTRRRVDVFPPSGTAASNSFFAQERPIDAGNDKSAGRLYVGINAPGTSQKTLLVRTYSILLAAAQAEIDLDPKVADPYGTLVGYFSSLRALGGAKRLVEDDVRNVRLNFLGRRRGLPRRNIQEQVHELTSRLKSWEIPSLLKLLERPFPRRKGGYPVDVLLATNMISVGVDIERLGVMVVAGQPKSTSEYIQATSRVGRASPGLVVTMYNWLGVRDLSHYERFRSYHEALYKFVEAISVTPYSSRAVERGLRGVLVSMARLGMPGLAPATAASRFDATNSDFKSILDDIESRAAAVLESKTEATTIRHTAEMLGDRWSQFADDPLLYRWVDPSRRPPNNERILLRPTGSPQGDGLWEAPSSLREVEQPAGFYIHYSTPDESQTS